MIGESLSHYRVTDQIGRGGMGIVYRAEDTRLDRTVALKLLPPHALASEDDRARFYREARAAAALSHPNIAHIYEIDEAAVEGGESRPFIAMEFIDGETLGERISKGPLPLKDAITIATQIADGLKAAHEKNIVHRDIKSGNVMLTKDGTPKILDFGLAKTAASTKLTQMGSTLGTVAYMSPEQAKGEEVDRRSDIWSLGVILYEMITGRLPFTGDYEQAIVYGILNENPESLTALRAGVPMALDGIMAKLLAKDPALRYQHVDELPADLKAIDLGSAVHTSRLSTKAASPVIPVPPVTSATRRTPPWIIAALAIGGIVLGFAAAAFLLRSEESSEPAVRRFFAVDPEQVDGLQNPKSLASAYISPDGQRIAFNADSKLWVRSLDNLRAVPVPGSEGAAPGFEWSLDSRSLVFVAGGVHRSVLLENNQVTSISDGTGGWWEFRRDGTIAAITGLTISGPMTTGVTREPITPEIPGLLTNGFVEIPGDRGFIVVREDSLQVKHISHVTGDGFRDVVTLQSESNAQDLVLTPTGHLLFTVEDQARRRTEVWAVALDLKAVEVVGGPRLVVGDARDPSVSEDGTLVYMQVGEADSIEVVVFDRRGREVQKEVSGLVGANAPEMSPDGRYIALDVNGSIATDRNIWIMDRELGGFFQLTFDGDPWRPTWSPDGRSIAYQLRPSGSGERDIYVQSIESGSSPVLLVAGPANDFQPSWSPDGEWIVFARVAETGAFPQIWRARADGTGEPEPVVSERFATAFPSVSPDGKYLAYVSDRSGQPDIFVATYPDGDRHARVTNRGAHTPKWRGDRIYFLDAATGDLMSTAVSTTPSFRARPPEMVASQEQVRATFSAGGVFLWDVSPDGSEIILVRDRDVGRTPRVIAVQNWRGIIDF